PAAVFSADLIGLRADDFLARIQSSGAVFPDFVPGLSEGVVESFNFNGLGIRIRAINAEWNVCYLHMMMLEGFFGSMLLFYTQALNSKDSILRTAITLFLDSELLLP